MAVSVTRERLEPGKGRGYDKYHFTFSEIMKLTGMSRVALTKHHQRGTFDPRDFESVIFFCVKYGTDRFREVIAREAIISRKPRAKD